MKCYLKSTALTNLLNDVWGWKEPNTISSAKAKTPIDDPEDFDFVTSKVQSADEIDSFLLDRSLNLDILDKYPNVRKAFLKFNNPIPCSAPVERLFSIAALNNKAHYNE